MSVDSGTFAFVIFRWKKPKLQILKMYFNADFLICNTAFVIVDISWYGICVNDI